MARMIPDRPAPETPASERRVYRRFREELPEDWSVIHSQRFLLPRRGRAREGEVDFLVLNPQRGAIGLEVKGGRIGRDTKGWFSLDRKNDLHRIKDPGRQAQTGIHALARYWEDSPRFGHKGFECHYCWGVVFPDMECQGDMGPGLRREIIVDRADLGRRRCGVDRVFRFFGRRGKAPGPNGVKALVAALRERRPPASDLAVQFSDENERLQRLTEEQKRVLESLAAHNRVAIEGAAGTGKTVLAMEKARRLALIGKRVLLLCFNVPLAQELQRRADGFEVETFHGLCWRLTKMAGVSNDVPAGSAARQRFFQDDLPLQLLEALEQLPGERYDAIVVDEGQDFFPGWWDCLDDALRKGREGTLYAFYDPNQCIYGGGPPAAMQVLPFRLLRNCRNTKQITRYAAAIVEDEAELWEHAPEGEKVRQIVCRSEAQVVAKVASRLRSLVRRGVDPGDIVIVSTHTFARSPFRADRRVGGFELVGLEERDGPGSGRSRRRRVVFETLHRFKGLESDVVILLLLPGGEHITPQHRYVAASRPRNLLIVVTLAG